MIGVGAFGHNHARVYRQLQQAGSVRLVGVVDPDTARADAIAREFDCKSFGSVEQMLTTHSEVQAASVAVPTVERLERLVLRPVTAIAGMMPSIRSASGFSSRSRNCRV